jgi:hypothetical protein
MNGRNSLRRTMAKALSSFSIREVDSSMTTDRVLRLRGGGFGEWDLYTVRGCTHVACMALYLLESNGIETLCWSMAK